MKEVILKVISIQLVDTIIIYKTVYVCLEHKLALISTEEKQFYR